MFQENNYKDLEKNIHKYEFKNIKTGVLLINLGTPESPSTKDVRDYLRQLLSSNRVIDINPVARWLLLNLFILQFRPRNSAKAYKKIWLIDGSPLLVNSQNLKKDLLEQLIEEDIHLELGMQCGNPSIKSALYNLRQKKCDRIIVLPLYPQYASSSFGSAIEDVYRENFLISKNNVSKSVLLSTFFKRSSKIV